MLILAFGLAACGRAPSDESYQREFAISDCALTPTGRNPYFILEPGYRVVLEGGGITLHITVLDETRTVDRVETRVVEEREWKDGRLYEISRNFFALCEATKDVFYFGEDVDIYEDGKVVDHAGAWLAGRDGARAGLFMPGAPKVGMKYYQELAPGIAMDRAEVVSLGETCTTPAGTFAECMKTAERSSVGWWSSLLFWVVEYNFYAPGVGVVQEENLRLMEYGFVDKGA